MNRGHISPLFYLIFFFVYVSIPLNLSSHQSDLHKYPSDVDQGKSHVNNYLNTDMTIDLDKIQKPILYLPEHDCEKQLNLPIKQVDCAGAKERNNIAYDHPEEKAKAMIGGVSDEIFSNCPISNLEKQTIFFSDKFDTIIAPQAWSSWRHSWPLSNKMQDYRFNKNMNNNSSLVYVKDKLVEAANKNYLSKAPNCDYWASQDLAKKNNFCLMGSGVHGEMDGWDSTINEFLWGSLLIFLETHITILRENLYTEDEKKLVHNWLEKKVWFIEQGPGNGTISKKNSYKPVEDPPNHHTISKILAFLLWGIADQNKEYFTAGVRGFESAYSVIREDGSILTEHKPSDLSKSVCLKNGPEKVGCGHGGFASFDRGNITAKFIVLIAIVLENQGYDIKSNYPKIERILEFTKLSIEDPLNKNFSKIWGAYSLDDYNKWNSLRYQSVDDSNPPMPHNNLGYMLLWDLTFGDNYSDVVPDYINQKAVTEFGILDSTCLAK